MAKLLSERDAIYSTKMNDRLFIKYRIIYETLEPEIIVVGSSRMFQISNQIIQEKVLNVSVGGSSIEDQITITEMALEKFKPKKILLGADPWLFNKYNFRREWKSLSKEYKLSLENIHYLKQKIKSKS